MRSVRSAGSRQGAPPGLVWLGIAGCAFALAGCSSQFIPSFNSKPDYGVPAPRRIVPETAENIPKGGGSYKIGKPYQIAGTWYYPKEEPGYDRVGIASWYGIEGHGRETANGEIFDMRALTAAHPTLPIPSYAYVTNLANGRTLLVRINDRGPYVNDRVIDLSKQAATLLGYTIQGMARVRVVYAGRAPLNGEDGAEKRFLMAQAWYRMDQQVAQLSSAPRPAASAYATRYGSAAPAAPTAPLRPMDAPPAYQLPAYAQQPGYAPLPPYAAAPTYAQTNYPPAGVAPQQAYAPPPVYAAQPTYAPPANYTSAQSAQRQQPAYMKPLPWEQGALPPPSGLGGN